MRLRGLALIGGAVFVTACGATTTTSQTQSQTPSVRTVTVRVQDNNGTTVANAVLTEVPVTARTASATSSPTALATTGTSNTGIHVQIKATSLSPGSHGLSFTSTGRCDPPNFVSAGPIFNPSKRLHGYDNNAGPKDGDLPNLAVGSDGTGTMDFVTNLVTLQALDASNGSALVINSGADDQKSQPDGNAGPRIGCGVVYPSKSETPTATPFTSPSARSTSTPATTPSSTPSATASATVTGVAN